MSLRGCLCEHVCACVGILLVWCACARVCTCACMRVAKGVLTYRCIRARICVRCVDVCIYIYINMKVHVLCMHVGIHRVQCITVLQVTM